jgi:hypothetical protein
MKKVLLMSIIVILVSSKFSFSQTILQKSIELKAIDKLGIIHSEYDSISFGLYNEFYTDFKTAFDKNLKAAGIDNFHFISEVLSYEKIDSNAIKEMCTKNDIDALLITKIYFLRNSFIYKNFLNLKQIEKASMVTGKADIYIEIKIFDKNSKMVIWTSDKVQTGNSSMVTPNWTINKGIEKSIKKIAKEKK